MRDPTKVSSAVLALMLLYGGDDRKQTSRSRLRVPQSPFRPIYVGCLNLFSVDLELDPSFATLKIFSSITEPYIDTPILVPFSGLTLAKGGGQQPDLVSIATCPVLVWAPLAGWGLSIVATPVPCGVPSTVLDLGKICSQPVPARHLLSFTFPLCSELGARVQGSRTAVGLGLGRAAAWEDEAPHGPDLVTE